MELSCKVDYACIALMQLAIRQGQGQPISVSEIAHSQNIPVRYLDQVMGMLRRAGIIHSQRGANLLFILFPKKSRKRFCASYSF
ncbi:Rrf2 family transcriptional regulator [Pseudanabaena sp. FACHB-1998]|uniref:Rrf2 family transcriptional regulator n=1 Tax=Pseudanabaena sp. FACHB-1998 TaxID=2692858 RepID=UPI001F54F46C|nr:Rrf2 family transcriptional regulator [Pseudanabaena sp. FACHB-1998]